MQSDNFDLTWIPERPALITPDKITTNQLEIGSWTDQKNQRRVTLIQKKYNEGIDASENAELEILQAELGVYLNKTYPLPFSFS